MEAEEKKLRNCKANVTRKTETIETERTKHEQGEVGEAKKHET